MEAEGMKNKRVKTLIAMILTVMLALTAGQTGVAFGEEPSPQDRVDAVIAAIEAIGPVITLESEARIQTAWDAYEALDASLKARVPSRIVYDLEQARFRLTLIKQNLVFDVTRKINAIGEVALTPQSANLIKTARTAYDALPADLYNSIRNYRLLTLAEETYAKLAEDDRLIKEAEKAIETLGPRNSWTIHTEAAIVAANAVFSALPAELRERVYNKDVMEKALTDIEKIKANTIKDIVDKIRAIGEVTLKKENNILAARTAYDSLPDALKGYIVNYNTLTSAETDLKTLKDEASKQKTQVDTVSSLIAGIGKVTNKSKSAISAARKAYDKLPEDLRMEVTNYYILIKAENDYKSLSSGGFKTGGEISGGEKIVSSGSSDAKATAPSGDAEGSATGGITEYTAQGGTGTQDGTTDSAIAEATAPLLLKNMTQGDGSAVSSSTATQQNRPPVSSPTSLSLILWLSLAALALGGAVLFLLMRRKRSISW